MPSLRRLVLSIAAALAIATAAGASPRLQTEVGEMKQPGVRATALANQARQIELSRGPAWRNFQARHGDWKAIWNGATGTPHRAFGQSFALPGFADDSKSVDRAVRGFIGQNRALFGGGPDLETASAERSGDLWYVRYHETVRGIPVLFADWEFRVGSNGRLAAFGADAYPTSGAINTTPRILASVAREAAKKGISFNPSTDRVTGATDLHLLPVTIGDRTELRLVYDVRVFQENPHETWLTLVDAVNGEVMWRHSTVHHAAISGKVTGKVDTLHMADPLIAKNLPNLYVTVGATQATTDSLGNYSVNCGGSVTVSAYLAGAYCHVNRLDVMNGDAHFSQNNVSCGTVRSIAWDGTNSQDSERDAYYHVNRAHDYIRRLDPSYTGSNYDIAIGVNSVGDECASYFDSSPPAQMVFGDGGTDCPNMATIPDVVNHEYAHRLNFDIYFSHGAPFGLTNDTVEEGCADIFTAFIADDPIIGEDYFGAGTYLRDLTVVHRWPEDRSEEATEAGLILAGAYWDLRQSVGLAVAEKLAHFAKYGLPDDPDDGVAMSDYFVETLLADDNDANLGNGTPHYNQIVSAFNAHGIGTNFFINIAHTGLDDQPTNGPFPISAVIQYTGPVGSLDTSSPRLFFRANGSPWMSRAMTPTGNPDEYGSEIPQQSAAIVNYYIQASETNGGVATLPSGAPDRKIEQFVAGPASAFIALDMEAATGWTVTNSGATSGFWTRVDPTGTIAQPEDDHSPSGTQCYVTGNGIDPSDPGFDDVDDGSTILTTSSFNALTGIRFPIISYYRWYSNNAGNAPNSNYWTVQISNNGGGSWVNVEKTLNTAQEWNRILFYVKDYITPTTNMKLRFIASDTTGALVEAAIDDFTMLAFTDPTVDIHGPQVPAELALAPAAPNPFHAGTRFRYTLPAPGKVDLAIFDIGGRSIRRLVTAEQPAGPHTLDWDGRDDAGRPVASGPYFLRLSQSGQRLTQAVLRIR